MAATESKIRLIFDGVDRVSAAAAKVKSAVKGLNNENSKLAKSFGTLNVAADKVGAGLAKIGKGILILGAAGSAVSTVGSLVGLLAQLSPIALALPGALLAGAAAMGAFKIATAGFGEAIGAGLSGDLEAFNKATKDMAPAMQDAAKAVVAFKPQIDDLKRSVQQSFWSKFSGDIKKLGDNLLPTLKSGLTSVSGELGRMVKGAVDVASTPLFRGQVASILTSTRATIENMRPALGNVLAGFVSLGEVGARFLPQLGTAITEVTAKFKAWATSTEGQTQIKKFIDNAIQGFKDLTGIVKNVGSILNSVFTGLGVSMASPLAMLKELTADLAAFLKTAEAQEGLKALGEILQTAGQAISEVFLAAVKELLPTIKEFAPAIKEIILGFKDFALELIAVAGPALRDFGKFLSENKDTIRDLIPVVIGLVAAFKGLSILISVAKWAKDAHAAFSLLGGLLPGVGKKAKTAGDDIDKANKKSGKSFGAVIGKAGLWGAAVVLAIDGAAGAIKGYTDEQKKAFDQGNFLEDLAIFAEEFSTEPFQAIGKEIVASLSPPPETVEFARKWAAFIDPGREAIRQGFERTAEETRQVPAKIGNALAGLGDVIAGVGNTATIKFSAEIAAGFERSRTIVAAVPGNIVAALSPLGGLLGVTGTTSTNQFNLSAQAGFAAGTAQTRLVPAAINAALSPLAGLLGNTATSSTDRFRSGATAGFNAATASARAVPGQINGAVTPLVGQLGTTGANAGNTFNQRLTGAINAARSAAAGAAAGINGAVAGALNLGPIGAAAGAALGRSLVAGINAQKSAVAGAAAGLAATVKANKGPIEKDRKFLIPEGKALVEGLIAGMNSQIRALAGFSSSLAPTIGGALGTSIGSELSISAPSSTGSAVRELVSTLAGRGDAAPQVRVFIGDTELTDIIRTEVTSSNRATRRTVGAGAGTSF